ncbi:MAG: hypothetical protein ACU84Q_02775 [Gammaproteobacteria bacterium]
MTSTKQSQYGQAMTEYTVILAFGLMVLLGPGIDVLKEMANVLRRNYEGYSYAISLSPLPDYGSGVDMRDAMVSDEIDQATIDQLGVDPLEDEMLEKLAAYTDFKEQLSDTVEDYTDIDIGDIWDAAEDAAVSFFEGLF